MNLRDSARNLAKMILGDKPDSVGEHDTVEDLDIELEARLEMNRAKTPAIPDYMMVLHESQEGGNDNYDPFREQAYLVTSDGVFQSIPSGFLEDPQLAAIVQSKSPQPYLPPNDDMFEAVLEGQMPEDYETNGWFTRAYDENLVASSIQVDRLDGKVDFSGGVTTATLVTNVDTFDEVMDSLIDNPGLAYMLDTICLDPFYIQQGKAGYSVLAERRPSNTPVPALAEGQSKGGDGESGAIIYRPPTGSRNFAYQAGQRDTPQPEACAEDGRPTLRDVPRPSIPLGEDDMVEIGPDDPLY